MRIVLAVFAALLTVLVVGFAGIGALGEQISPEVLMGGAMLAGAAVAALVLKFAAKPHEKDEKDGAQRLFGEVMEELKRSTRARISPTAIFTLSLIAFVAAAILSGSYGIADAICLVGVLFFHELGHAAAMRAFGYSDVKVFFIPFLGAAAAGVRRGAPVWQQAVVLLAGPVPGIVVGLLVGLLPSSFTDALPKSVVPLLIGLNALNLLPIEPLDGGRLVGLLLFGGLPRVRASFSLVTGVIFVLIARLEPVLTGAIAGAIIGSIAVQWQAAAAADHARRTLSRAWPELPPDIAAADQELLRVIFEKPAENDKGSGRLRARRIATKMRIAYDMLRFVPVSRAIGIPIGVAFLLGTTAVGARLAGRLGGDAVNQFAGAFLKSCTATCEQTLDAKTCNSICTCRADDTRRFVTGEYLKKEFNVAARTPSADFKARLDEGVARCGGDLWDRVFTVNCERACGAAVPGSTCRTHCSCVLAGLRGPGDRRESTLWLVRNIDKVPPTSEGDARIHEVTSRCLAAGASDAEQ